MSHNLSAHNECETIVDYCSKVVQLEQNVCIFWNADLEDKCFRICDLQYLRQFICIAGWLQGQGKLKTDDYTYYMILLKDSSHDTAEPFEPEAIRTAAEAILGVDRCDTERLRSGDLYEEDSEEDQPSTRRKKTMARSRKTQLGWKDDKEDSDDEDFNRALPRKVPQAMEKESKVSKDKVEEKEFEGLADKMKKLSVTCTMKPIAAECLPCPQVNQAVPNHFDGRRMMPLHMPHPDSNQFLSYRQPAGHIMGECPC
ncbi:hypothetical protein PYCCODRAFT_1446148 [Trametes coccinea BRFM310]|uniref:Uncharacterized protein n=1 Tax=Trametes coccinea (strain BRFM310) TaxID=1353009 RepID=A0A1Y2IHD9_TRAC3|nr:hypothetical protein PYCCODRAFT_1446148 [Trametes coccinea BRFM310]